MYNRRIHESVVPKKIRLLRYASSFHLSFLPFVSSSISLTEGEKWYKEGVNEVIQNYAKPYKDRILSVSFSLHF